LSLGMISNPGAELARRNARLRAWREYGVPVAGGWIICEREKRGRNHWIDLKIFCRTCDQRGAGYSINLEGLAWPELSAAIVAAERYEILQVCTHLAPLLGAEPPEVVELTHLELLAGDPPG
jgi:hypothetical protein